MRENVEIVEYTLSKISNLSLFKLIIADKVLITLKYFLPINVQFNWQKLSCFSERLSFNPRFFFAKNAKSLLFEEKWFGIEVLYQI